MGKTKERKEIKNKPARKVIVSPVTATIWKNVGMTKDGQKKEFRTVSLQRNYKDKQGNWQNTTSLRVNDLPKAALAIQKAYEHIVSRREDTEAADMAEGDS